MFVWGLGCEHPSSGAFRYAFENSILFADLRPKQEVSTSDLLGGVAASLCKEYADQPCSVVEDAVAAAVQRAIAAESYPAENVACDVDFGAACPEGALYAARCFVQPLCVCVCVCV